MQGREHPILQVSSVFPSGASFQLTSLPGKLASPFLTSQPFFKVEARLIGQKLQLLVLFPILQDGGEKTEKPDAKEKNCEAKKADLMARLRRVTSRPRHLRRGSPTATETLSSSEELAGIPGQLCIPERPWTRGSTP